MQDQDKLEKAKADVFPRAIDWRRAERRSIGSGSKQDRERTYDALNKLRDVCDRAGAADE